MNKMILSDSQQEVFSYITTNLPIRKVILLEGSAGTGKTTLTKYICNYYNQQKRILVCAIAPTHKAKKVIENVLNKDTILPVSSLTVASALGKIKEHSYVGTKIYSNGNNRKLSNYNLFIIDEVSMTRDEDLRLIVNYVLKTNKQLLIIGDSNQIPCPSAKYISCPNNIIKKADSYIFTDPDITKVKLVEIMRQSLDSPIINLALFIRDHLLTDIPFDYIIQSTQFTNIIKYTDIYDVFKTHFVKNGINSCRIISYTNSAVKTHNLEVRNHLGYDTDYVVGELMTGYSNLGWPELIIENGEDYFIQKIQPISNHRIHKYSNLVGNMIDLVIADTGAKVDRIFFIHINHPNNNEFIYKLIELAEKINSQNSTRDDYRDYMQMKNCVIFTEDIYKYENKIFTETSFKETHAMLFVNINEIIVDGKMKDTQLSNKINTAYPNIINQRITDKYKQFGDSELFADKYKVIEKDLYYGYAITAHKSQGSTYNTAIVDEPDFQKIQNKWNYKFNKLESRTQEKNQLRYVAYTRAKTNLFIIYEMKNREANTIIDLVDDDDTDDFKSQFESMQEL